MSRPDSATDPAVVVGFGAVAVDSMIYVDQPFGAGKGRIIRRETSYGGNVATALAAVADLGGRPRFVGYLPDADAWPGVHQDLAEHGIDATDATVVAGAPPIQSTILVAPGGARFIAFDDDCPIGAPADLDLQVVTSAQALLVDGYAPGNGLRAVLAARAAGVPVVGDLELADMPGRQALQDAIGHLVVPLAFALRVTEAQTPEAAVRALWTDDRDAVVVTDGEHGCWFAEAKDGLVQHFPAFEVAVVDTNGCGDVFHGAYAYSIATGFAVPAAVRRAAAASAVAATGVGGRGRLPNEADVQTLLDTAQVPAHPR
ncbi:PfkB family carbohydrate kinase [Rhodococcus opacus]|uniref:PfkB family carbohydrate kinase n=1 Tax=Rhodococcus opacus TaxID=37919 RepID=UPI001C46F05D|nr:PfkB family carbohydrate kinase [Rhodococcus opacus]MBV6760400.1 hypothetical protein [Rhodococcus opacus]